MQTDHSWLRSAWGAVRPLAYTPFPFIMVYTCSGTPLSGKVVDGCIFSAQATLHTSAMMRHRVLLKKLCFLICLLLNRCSINSVRSLIVCLLDFFFFFYYYYYYYYWRTIMDFRYKGSERQWNKQVFRGVTCTLLFLRPLIVARIVYRKLVWG